MKKFLLLPLLFIALSCSSDEMDDDMNDENTEQNSLFNKLDNQVWNIKEISEIDDSNCELGCINGFGFSSDKSITYIDFYGGAEECQKLTLSNLNEQENKITVNATAGTNSLGKLTFTLANNVLVVNSVGGIQNFTFELIKENESLKSLCN